MLGCLSTAGLLCKVAQLGVYKVTRPSLAQIMQFYVFFMDKRMKGDWTKSSRRAHFWGFAVSNYGVAFWAFFLFVVGASSFFTSSLLLSSLKLSDTKVHKP